MELKEIIQTAETATLVATAVIKGIGEGILKEMGLM